MKLWIRNSLALVLVFMVTFSLTAFQIEKDVLVTFKGETEASFYPKEFTEVDQLVATNLGGDLPCEVISFALYRERPGENDVIEVIGNGANIEGNVLKLIKTAKAGDFFSFANVQVRYEDGVVLKAAPLVFNIK